MSNSIVFAHSVLHRLLAVFVFASLSTLALYRSADAATLVVDPGACAPPSANYCTIQAAIDAAAAGDTVQIKNGVYPESLDIYKPLTLEGESRDGVLINASAFADYGIDVQGDFAFVFRNFTLDGPDGNVSGRYGLKIAGDAAQATVEDVRVLGSGRSGIDINGANSVVLRRIVAENNGGAGIALTDSSNVTLDTLATNNNAWGGVAIYTYGRYYTGGSNNINLTGVNTFAESIQLYIEVANFTTPAAPYPVTNFTQNSFSYLVTNSLMPAYTFYQATAAGAASLANVLPAAAPSPQNSAVTVLATGSIQATIDAADAGDTINVAPGVYAETIVINKHVKIDGAGSGADPADNTILRPASGHVVTIGGSGASALNPLLLKDLRVESTNAYGINIGTSRYIRLDNVEAVGLAAPNGAEEEACLKVATTADVSDVVIENSAFRDCAFGWYIAKDMPPTTTSNFKNIYVANTVFTGNDYKGIYAEKMSDATFTNVVVANNGNVNNVTIYFNVKWNAGIDINLKGQAYQNLSFYNLIVANNGLGAEEGAGLMIKARDDGATYGANPASLVNVSIEGGMISGNERGLRFGEPGKNNAGPAATLRNVAIFGNVKSLSSPAGSAAGGLINQTQAQIDARNNWWGASNGPSSLGAGSGDAIVNASSGSVLFDPYLSSAVLSVPATPIVLQRTAPKIINVPVLLAPLAGDQIASAAFSVDYDQICLSTNASKVTGLPAGFQNSVAFDAADTDGELDVAIWSNAAPPVALPAGALLSVEFTVLDGCWGTDRTVDVLFSNQPAPSFGNPAGQTLFRSSAGASIPLDFNSAPTDISLSAASVAENAAVGSVVGLFSSNDPDVDSFTYSLVSGVGGEDNAAFTIVGNELRTATTFDFETKSVYYILVKLDDGKGGVVTKAFTITITNVNDAPTDIALSNNKVFEAALANSVVGIFSTTDQDTGDAFTYALVAGAGDTDNAAFTISGSQLLINASPDFGAQASYTIRVRSTDTGALSIEKQFTIQVIDRSELSLPGELDLSWVAYSGNARVSLHFLAKGNAVRSAAFAVDYDETCLTFTGLSNFQSGWSGATTPGGGGVLGIALNGTTDLVNGAAVALNFSANDACASGTVSQLDFTGATTLKDVGNQLLPAATTNGALHIVANDARGDCNSDDLVNAADFVAEVLESFDANIVPSPLPVNHWLYVHTGSFVGSAIGCDANTSAHVDVADILCTVLVVFGDNSCTLPAIAAAATQPAILTVTGGQAVAAGEIVEIPISLRGNGEAIAGAAFRVNFDAQQVAVNPADANHDGIPDAIRFNVPVDLMRSVKVSEDGASIDIAVADLSLPLFELPDNVLVEVAVTVKPSGAAIPLQIGLNNASLGNTNGMNVPVDVEVVGQATESRLYLPILRR